MIVSYHPLFEGDIHRLAAGRDPAPDDEARIREARAVILPQGCRESWYRLAKNLCPNVFPNYDARFQYPGKTGQIRLFRESGVRHPKTRIFPGLASLEAESGLEFPPVPMPFVFKFDWGDEGRTVFRVAVAEDWAMVIELAGLYETTGQRGFIIQEYIPADGRSLRVAVVGNQRIAYWRVMNRGDRFAAGVGKGAEIDPDSDPELRGNAVAAANAFCRHTGVNLAGLDLLFSTDPSVADTRIPLFIEINYYFGRSGLDGSEGYYRLLIREILAWLEAIGLGDRPFRKSQIGPF